MEFNLGQLPQSFRHEELELKKRGINSWQMLSSLSDTQLLSMIECGMCTTKNLKKLKAIAIIICELNITYEYASLMIYSGIANTRALAKYTPENLVKVTGRLKRNLIGQSNSKIDLKTAKYLIDKAKYLFGGIIEI